VRLFFESVDKSACPLQGNFAVVDAEEQEQAVARCSVVRTHQSGMFVRAPLVETKQYGPIGIQDLTKVVMARRGLGLAKERLVPSKATGNVPYADDCPSAFHFNSAFGSKN
jgi:hypothetical protein